MVESTRKIQTNSRSPKRAKKVQTQYDKLLKVKNMTDAHDRSYGSMIGAFIGDSLGSYLEFGKGI